MKLKKTVKGVGSKGNTLRGSVLKKTGKRDKPYEVRTPIDPRTKKRGFFYARTYDEAVQLLYEKNLAIQNGETISTSKMNFGELVEAYYKDRFKNDVPHIIQLETLDHNIKRIKNVKEKFNKIKISNMAKNLQDVYNFIIQDKYRGQIATTRTIKDKIGTINQILFWGVERKLFSYREIESINSARKRIKNLTGRPSEKIEAYTINEMKFILEKTKHNFGLNALIQFQYYLGLRCEEVLGLKWANFDNINNILHIRGVVTAHGYKDITKTPESRRDLYIPKILRKLIKEIESANLSQITKDSFILPKSMFYKDKEYCTNNRVLYSDKIGQLLRRIFNKTEMAGRVQTHNFRRTFATHSADNGVPIEKLMYILGHKDIKMTFDSYYKNSAYQIKQITINKIDKFFEETYQN